MKDQQMKVTMDIMEKGRISGCIHLQRLFFQTGRTRDESFRREKLKTLYEAICTYEKSLLDALWEDLGKAFYESYETEISMVKEEIRFALRRLHGWMGEVRVPTHSANFPATSRIYREPLGVVLILSPWNYPVYLALCPLVSALAAGDCAVVKPSRCTPATSAVLEEMINKYFEPEYVMLLRGSEGINDFLLKERFDHIFFTGSPSVGRRVMKAAAEHLTSVTLELGGKSPCIVDETAKIDLAARRIIWGKCINAGQTCVAPDYILVKRSVKEKLIQSMERYICAFYGTQPLMSKDLPKIVNGKHFDRLLGLLEGQTIRFGGTFDKENRKISPTILDEPNVESPLMQEEIFGPLLPILSFDQFDQALEFIKQREKPLACYLFTEDKGRQSQVVQGLSFGGGCINDTILHLVGCHLPFGGVGGSGMGAYHGKKGFDIFTHEKSVVKKSTRIDIPLRYPPYGEGRETILKFLLGDTRYYRRLIKRRGMS